MNDTAVAQSTERQAFYDRIGEHSLAPLWERLHSMVTRAPVTPALPTKWDYDAVVRPFLMQAGGLITAKEAAIRVALHHRGSRRLHRGGGRTHDDGARRFRHHTELDVARPRQRYGSADGLARWSRRSDRPPVRRQFR